MQHDVPEPCHGRAPFQSPRAVLRVRDDGVLLSANPGSTALLSEWKCEVGQMVPGHVRQAVEQALAQDSPAELETRAGGRHYSLLVAPIGECAYAGIFEVTERKKDEMRLRQMQKLESIGVLAGGVAHEFNNLLVGVIGSACLVRDMLPPDSPAVELLQAIVRAGQQAAHLTKQLLAYSGQGQYIVEPVDLSDLVREVTALMSPAAPNNVAIRLELEPGLPAIEADRSQMHQAITDLVTNATEAIGEDTGSVVVRTGSRRVDERVMQDGAEIRPGRYVFLEVRDTGCGMDEAVKARMFDPFFTTKFQGRGLGLAAAAGIVRGHKGVIRVTTAPGRGTSFLLLFPALDAQPALPAAQREKSQKCPLSPGRGGRTRKRRSP